MPVAVHIFTGQPICKLLMQPDPAADCIFVFSPAVFISQAAKLKGIECDQSHTEAPFHVAPVWRLKIEKHGNWHPKGENFRLFISTATTVPGEYDWYLLKFFKNSGTPTMAPARHPQWQFSAEAPSGSYQQFVSSFATSGRQ